VPVGFRILLPQHHAAYRSEHALLREMVGEFVPPSWAKRVMVGGEAASGSKATMRMVQDRDPADPARRWGLVFALARPWKTVEEQTLKHLVPHVPYKYDQRPQGPRETVGTGRRTFWTSHTRWCLRQVGAVPWGLRKKGRTVGPHNPQLLVTNLAAWTPRHVVSIAQKRWAIARVNWARTSGLGLGQHQVSRHGDQMETSVGIAVLASLVVRRVCHHEIVPGKPWSIFQLQQALRLRAMTNQVEHKVKVKMAKTRKAA